MQIIGHTPILSFFEQARNEGRLSHAYGFWGPQHVGKRAVAQHIAQTFFCGKGESPCGQCHDCQSFQKGMHPDYYLVTTVEGKHQIGIEQVRGMIRQVYQAPVLGQTKVLIVDDAHLMSTAAANALLKTLEEPPKSCIIFVITHAPDRLPSTIASRVQVFEFGRVLVAPDVDENNWALSRGLPGIYIRLQEGNDEGIDYREEVEAFKTLLQSSKGERLHLLEPWFKKADKHAQQKSLWKERLGIWRFLLRDAIMLQLEGKAQAGHIRALRSAIDELSLIERRLGQNIHLRSHLERFCLKFP